MWPVLGNTLVPSGGVQFLPMSCRINGFRRQNAPEQVLPCCEPCPPLRTRALRKLPSITDFRRQGIEMTPRGFELSDESPLSAKDLLQSSQDGAAKSGADKLDALLAMLSALSPSDRARLAALLTGQAEGEARP
jgi:hypothetical protein